VLGQTQWFVVEKRRTKLWQAPPLELVPPAAPPLEEYGNVAILLTVVNACKPVKDASDLLILRETLLEELDPAYMWLFSSPSWTGPPCQTLISSSTLKCSSTAL
jgi:hypothetical protein